MLKSATQNYRQLAVFTPFGKDVLLLDSFEGEEALSELSHFSLRLLSQHADLDPKEILGRNLTFRVDQEGNDSRFFNGYVKAFALVDMTDRMVVYTAEVVPWLWFLTNTTDCRIFQDKDALEIIVNIFDTLGFKDYQTSGLTGDFRKREYCVQYRESDFEFVSRLMEEEGIYYYFRHENGKHTLVLENSTAGYFAIEQDEVSVVRPAEIGVVSNDVVNWRHRKQMVSTRWATRDYDFANPDLDLISETKTKVPVLKSFALEKFDFPGGYTRPKDGQHLTRVRMEQEEARHEVISAEGVRATFTPGGSFQVKRHPNQSLKGSRYALTRVRYVAGSVGGYTTVDRGSHEPWMTYFEAIPESVVYRPERKTRRPIVEGPQTAMVVGPAGEEIYTDKDGRIKVQFHWDREGSRNEKSSCWIRVSQVHAGSGFGAIDIPRIGQEVIVSFLEGDPDQPIVKGRVYNAAARPPFALPGAMTRSGGKSNTHKGSGYNEMSMDDTAGKEQLRTNAQFNQDTSVGNNQTLNVGKDRTHSIGNNDSLTVGANSKMNVGVDAKETVGNDEKVVVGSNIEIDAGVAITLKCGQSTIHMNQGGVITISGQFVSSLAKVTNSIIAPMTSIAGSTMLNQIGLVCLDVGGIKHIKGGETSISASSIDIEGKGITIIKGAPIKLGEAGAPVVAMGSVTPAASAASGLDSALSALSSIITSPVLGTVVGHFAKQYMLKLLSKLIPPGLAKILSAASSFAQIAKAIGPYMGEVVKKLWNLPNTALGLIWGGLGHVAGEIRQAVGSIFGINYPEPEIGFFENGSNAIEFHNNLFMSSAMTLGNVIIYGGGGNGVAGDPQFVPVYDENGHIVKWATAPSYGTVRDHEREHTHQGELLGPLYVPYALGSYLYGGIASMISQGSFSVDAFEDGTHGPHSHIEGGPQSSHPSAFGGQGPPTYNTQTGQYSNLPPDATLYPVKK